MQPVPLIVCERYGRWAMAIRRLLGNEAEVRETRGPVDLRQELAALPESLVAMELGALPLSALCDFLAEMERAFPLSAAVILGEADVARHAALLLETGAILCLDSPRRLAPLVAIARRQRARAPRRDASLVERIWARLPLGSD